MHFFILIYNPVANFGTHPLTLCEIRFYNEGQEYDVKLSYEPLLLTWHKDFCSYWLSGLLAIFALYQVKNWMLDLDTPGN